MGRGSSKAGGGGKAVEKELSQAVSANNISNPELKETIQGILKKNLVGGAYSYNQSVKDGKVIDKTTDIGDAFIYQNKNGSITRYVKTDKNTWELQGGNHVLESDGMARVISSLDWAGVNWKYKVK